MSWLYNLHFKMDIVITIILHDAWFDKQFNIPLEANT